MKATITLTEVEIKQAIGAFVSKQNLVRAVTTVSLNVLPGFASTDQRENRSPSVSAAVEVELGDKPPANTRNAYDLNERGKQHQSPG